MDYYTKDEIDQQRQSITTSVTAELQGMQAVINKNNSEIRAAMEGLATKEDVKAIGNFIKNMNFGVGVFKISWHIIATVGGFISAIVAIGLFFKFIAAGIIGWILTKS